MSLDAPTTVTPRRARQRPRRWLTSRRRLGVFGIMLIVIGALVVGWLAWQFVISGLVAHVRYASQVRELRTQWETAEPPTLAQSPPAGQAYAILRVPHWGELEIPIIAGTAPESLARGVGAYPSSTPPGELGNLAIAGYRTTHGGPFSKLLELDAGAEVVIETHSAVYVYVLDVPARDITVRDTDTWVLDPVPGTDDEPTRPTLTLTTSQDLVWSADRSVAFGHLGSTRNK